MQPAFLIALFSVKDNSDVQTNNGNDLKHSTDETSSILQESKKSNLIEALLLYARESGDLIKRYCLEGIFKFHILVLLMCLLWYILDCHNALSFLVFLKQFIVTTTLLFQQSPHSAECN